MADTRRWAASLASCGGMLVTDAMAVLLLRLILLRCCFEGYSFVREDSGDRKNFASFNFTICPRVVCAAMAYFG
jgi:hypothetical protein